MLGAGGKHSPLHLLGVVLNLVGPEDELVRAAVKLVGNHLLEVLGAQEHKFSNVATQEPVDSSPASPNPSSPLAPCLSHPAYLVSSDSPEALNNA